MRRLKGLSDLLRDGLRLIERDRAFRDPIRERRTFDKLPHEGMGARGILNTVDRRDIGMIERGEKMRLAAESRDAIAVDGEGIGQIFIATSRLSLVSRAR